MYTDIKIRFKAYQNNGKNDPNTVEKYVLNELEWFCRDVALINQCMIDVCRYFKVARLLPRNHAFFQAVKDPMPDLTQRDKDIRLWMIIERPSLAEEIEKNKPLNAYLSNSKGLNPTEIINHCFRTSAFLFLKEKRDGLSGNTHFLFLEFLAADYDAVENEAKSSFSALKKEAVLDKSFCAIADLCPTSGFGNIVKKFNSVISYKSNLTECACKNHNNIGEFEDNLYVFEKDLVNELLRRVYYKKCSESLDPMYEAFRFIIYTRSLYSIIYLIYLTYAPRKLLAEIHGLDPIQKALHEMVAFQQSMTSIQDAANLALQGFFTAALTARPEWKLNLRFLPDFNDIPRTEENFVKDECWNTLQYGGSYNHNKNDKVYQTEQLPGFARVYDTDTKQESIYRFKNGRLQNGNYRVKWTDGSFCFGKRIFATTSDNEEEDRVYRLYKSASGNIEYDEKIFDDEWRKLTKYTFNPNKLEWIKVNL